MTEARHPDEDKQPVGPSAHDAKKALEAQQEALARVEAKEVPGALSRTPKQAMINAKGLEDENPDKHYRYLSTANKDRMPLRTHAEGYRPVSEEEAEKAGVNARLGNLILAEQPRKVHDQRVAAQNAENERRLKAHETSMEQVAESVARTLRDKHGMSIDAERLLVKE